jgi:hypothetical protein
VGLFARLRRKREQDESIATLTAGFSSGSPIRTGTFTAHSITVNGKPATPADVHEFEQITGIDLDGDGRVAGGSPGAAPQDRLQRLLGEAMARADQGAADQGAADPSADRIALLERLAALRASGAITAAEYESEKSRILAS